MTYSKALEDHIDHYYINKLELIKKKQMGGVGWLINGNMCSGIYENLLVVRIDPDLVEILLKKQGIRLFGNSKDKNSFISVAPKIYRHPKALNKFLSHALEFTSTLEPKE